MKTTGCVLSPREYRTILEPPASLEDTSRYGNDGVFTGAGEPDWAQLPSGLWVLDFDGINDIVTIGDCVANIQTFIAWIKPDDITTRSIIDLDGGTHSVEIDGASDITATGWAAPTIYVDAVVAAAVTVCWHFIAVTTATAIDASSVVLGQEVSFYDGKLWNARLFTYVLTIDQIYSIYQNERGWFGV